MLVLLRSTERSLSHAEQLRMDPHTLIYLILLCVDAQAILMHQ